MEAHAAGARRRSRPLNAQLARNCEYATDMPEFEEPFLDELEYIARLWRNAESEAQFNALYDPAVSRSHDAI